jgi:hypothetical protein
LATKELLKHDNVPSYTSFFKEFFTKNNTTVVPHPPYFSVSQTEEKLQGRHFDTIEVIEAFCKMTSAGNGAYTRKGTTSKVMVASSPKVNF